MQLTDTPGIVEWGCDWGTPAPRILYVDDDAPGDPGPGDPTDSDPLEDGSLEHPFDATQEAIDLAWNRDTVIVLDGIYTGIGNRDVDFLGKAITVQSQNGPENCIIDCEGTEAEPHRGFYIHRGEGEDSVLVGFTVTNGYGHNETLGPHHGSTAGAIFCDGSSPTVTNCCIAGNTAAHGGGVVCAGGSNVVLTGCEITHNAASVEGGGIFTYDSSPKISGCFVTGNDCAVVVGQGAGGGIMIEHESPVISNCVISGNQAGSNSGAIGIEPYATDSPTITNCLISDNFCGVIGGGIEIRCAGNTLVRITNCTITGNHAEPDMSAGLQLKNSSPTVTNCIFWDNSGDEIARHPQHPGDPSDPDVTYCDVQGGWPGEGNIDADPLFADPAGGDYRLLGPSPCIDTGDNAAVPPDVTTDLDGNPRMLDGDLDDVAVVDMGAYELLLIKVPVDIKPGSCPNPLNTKSKGVLPVAILGTEDFDIGMIDVTCIRLIGVAPVRSAYEDVATPVAPGADECECTTEGPDGYLDMTLKFKTQDIVAALGEIDDGDVVALTLTGETSDSFAIGGRDCVVIRKKGKGK